MNRNLRNWCNTEARAYERKLLRKEMVAVNISCIIPNKIQKSSLHTKLLQKSDGLSV